MRGSLYTRSMADARTGPLIIAHRTCPANTAENSLEGLRIAAELGADGVEIDLRLSADGLPFLMHDWTMRRTTGWPLPIEATPSFIVRRLRLKNGQPVPSLGSCLDALPENLLLAVDVKTPWAIFALVRAIKQRYLEDRVLVWCTSALDVRYASRRLPHSETAYLNDVQTPDGKRAFVEKARSLGARAISAHWLAIDSGIVDDAHRHALQVYSYHSGYDLAADKLTAGLDGLITDFPVEARQAVASITKPR